MIINRVSKEADADYFVPKAILFDVIKVIYSRLLKIFVFLSAILYQSYLQRNFDKIENMKLNDDKD